VRTRARRLERKPGLWILIEAEARWRTRATELTPVDIKISLSFLSPRHLAGTFFPRSPFCHTRAPVFLRLLPAYHLPSACIMTPAMSDVKLANLRPNSPKISRANVDSYFASRLHSWLALRAMFLSRISNEILNQNHVTWVSLIMSPFFFCF